MLTSLHVGHFNKNIRDYLTKHQPKTVQEAERLCDEFEARARVRPVKSKFVSAMSSNGPLAVDQVQAGGGYRGPKARGGQRGRPDRGQDNRNLSTSNENRPTCFRCGKTGHVARYCRAPAPMQANPRDTRRTEGAGGRQNAATGPPAQQQQQRGRPVLNVAATPTYADSGVTREHQRMMGWQPSHLPEFDAAEPQHEEGAYVPWSAQDEVIPALALAQVNMGVGLTYVYGSPNRRPSHRYAPVDEASTTVRKPNNKWWVTAVFPRTQYLLKVDTGAHVNVMSLADLSCLGYLQSDLQPSNLYLVGFNAAVVKPRGELPVKITVNGQTFETVFQVVDRCNSPLLSLKDAERAGLVILSLLRRSGPRYRSSTVTSTK